jgi:hypothetical protein
MKGVKMQLLKMRQRRFQRAIARLFQVFLKPFSENVEGNSLLQ